MGFLKGLREGLQQPALQQQSQKQKIKFLWKIEKNECPCLTTSHSLPDPCLHQERMSHYDHSSLNPNHHGTKYNKCAGPCDLNLLPQKTTYLARFSTSTFKVTHNSLGKVDLLFKITYKLQKKNVRHYNELIQLVMLQNLNVNSLVNFGIPNHF